MTGTRTASRNKNKNDANNEISFQWIIFLLACTTPPPAVNLEPPDQVVRFKAENARCAFLEGAGMRLELIEVCDPRCSCAFHHCCTPQFLENLVHVDDFFGVKVTVYVYTGYHQQHDNAAFFSNSVDQKCYPKFRDKSLLCRFLLKLSADVEGAGEFFGLCGRTQLSVILYGSINLGSPTRTL